MPTNYPGTLDDSTTLPTVVAGGIISSAETNTERGALKALEAKVGASSYAPGLLKSIHYKLNQGVIYLDDYCVGDGVTDDTAAFQSAATALVNGGCLVGSKTYLLTSLVTMPDVGGLKFIGVGGAGIQTDTSATLTTSGATVLCRGATAGIKFSPTGQNQHHGPSIENVNFVDAGYLSTYKAAVTGARVSNIVTLTVGTGTGLTTGDAIMVYAATPSTFTGRFTITSNTTTTVTYSQAAADETMTNGKVRRVGLATMLQLNGVTRSYVRRCTFTGGAVGVLTYADAAGQDASWSRVDNCHFLGNEIGMRFQGTGNYSHYISGGNIGMLNQQKGIYCDGVGQSKVVGMKFDTADGAGIGSVGIDYVDTQHVMIQGVGFELDLAVTAAIRLGDGVTGSPTGSIIGCSFQHNSTTEGTALIIRGAGVTSGTRAKGINIIGCTFNQFVTAIDLSNAWNTFICGGSILNTGTTGINIASTCTHTRIIGFSHAGTGALGTFINDAGVGTVVALCSDESSAGSVATRQGVGTTHEAAGTPSGGYSGEIRLATGKIWVNDAGTWKSVAVA